MSGEPENRALELLRGICADIQKIDVKIGVRARTRAFVASSRIWRCPDPY